MTDVQHRLGVKNMSHLVRKEIQGIWENKYPTEKHIKKYKRSEKELDTLSTNSSPSIKYVCSDLMGKIIKNCHGVRHSNDGINKMEKRNQRENFRILLGFKENDIHKESVFKSNNK